MYKAAYKSFEFRFSFKGLKSNKKMNLCFIIFLLAGLVAAIPRIPQYHAAAENSVTAVRNVVPELLATD